MENTGETQVTTFVADLRRWISELERQNDQRSTLWFGIAQRAFTGFDHFLGWLIAWVVNEKPEQSRPVLDAVLNRKPLDKATLGEKISILRSLDRQRLVASRQILNKADNKALDAVNVDRNAAAHEYGWEVGQTQTLKMLKLLLDLSQRIRQAIGTGEPA